MNIIHVNIFSWILMHIVVHIKKYSIFSELQEQQRCWDKLRRRSHKRQHTNCDTCGSRFSAIRLNKSQKQVMGSNKISSNIWANSRSNPELLLFFFSLISWSSIFITIACIKTCRKFTFLILQENKCILLCAFLS